MDDLRSRPDADVPALARLLEGSAAGDAVAFRQLYDLQAPRLYGLALRMTRQPALAADAVHDAFVQVWQRASAFDPMRGSPEAWLGSLLRYRTIDILRRDGRERTGLDRPEEADPDPGPLDALMSSSDGRALRACLDQLEGPHRQAVLLAFIDGLSHSEMATRLRTPLGTVKSWVRRALLSLRKCLEP